MPEILHLQQEGIYDRHCMIFSLCVLVGVLVTLGSFSVKAVLDLNSILSPELRDKLITAIHLLLIYSVVILVSIAIFLVSVCVPYLDTSFSKTHRNTISKTYEKMEEIEEESSSLSSSLEELSSVI